MQNHFVFMQCSLPINTIQPTSEHREEAQPTTAEERGEMSGCASTDVLLCTCMYAGEYTFWWKTFSLKIYIYIYIYTYTCKQIYICSCHVTVWWNVQENLNEPRTAASTESRRYLRPSSHFLILSDYCRANIQVHKHIYVYETISICINVYHI